MAAKITCPHCDAVLKPAKPLAAGKKVNCPRCGEVFTVRDEEEEEEARPARAVPARPAKKAAPAKAARPAKPAAPAPPPKKSAADDDDDGELTYGVIREPEDEEDKPKVDYVPDLTVKDRRGKAVMVLGLPSNFLLGLSAVICIGALVAVGVFVWKFIFPPEFWVDPGTVLTKDSTLKKDTNLPKDDPPPPKKREEYDKNKELPKIEEAEEEEKNFCIIWAIVSGVIMIYYAVVAMATVKMQNLESYNWAMTAGIMASVSLIGAPLGIWAISLLRQPDIKAAFEYVAE